MRLHKTDQGSRHVLLLRRVIGQSFDNEISSAFKNSADELERGRFPPCLLCAFKVCGSLADLSDPSQAAAAGDL